MADDRALGEPERLHPLFLLTGIGGALRGVAGAYAFIAWLAVTGRLATAIFAALALLAMLAVGLLLYWHRFEFRVGENEIRIDSGILSRTHRSIPFDRIQDVEITQGPLARLLGLAKVKFETGGSAGSGEEEGSLQAIALERAQDIRALIRSSRSGVVEPAEESHEQGPPVFAMNLQRVLLAGLFNFSLALFAGLFGLTQTFGDVFGFDPLRRDFWAGLLSAGHPIAEYLMEHRSAAAAAGLILLILVGLLTGVARSVLRDYGFRLDRTDVGLRRRRGLLTKSDVTVPVSRAQAAILASGPVREAFGWRELRLQSLARDEGGKGDHVLAPLASDEESAAVLQELGWRPVPARADWQPISRAYVWAFVLGLSPLLLVAIGPMAMFGMAMIVMPAGSSSDWQIDLAAALTASTGLLLVLLGVLLIRFIAWRRTRYALDDDRLLIRTGWWRRRTLILPIRRIQSIDLTQNFVSRWFGAASLRFGVAGGSGFSAHEIPSLPAEKARDLRKQLIDYGRWT